MSEEQSKLGLLEIVHDERGKLAAFCPYRDETVDANVCFACKDCSGLALSPDGKTSYVVCERAARDGLWVSGGGERPAAVHACCGCGAELQAPEDAAGSAQRPAAGSAQRPAAGSAQRPAAGSAQRPAAGSAQRPAAGPGDAGVRRNELPRK